MAAGGPGSRPSGRNLGRLTASTDAHAADWILALRDFDYTVGSIVPPVFDAYARVFHPASRRGGETEIPVTWADVAKANGRKMHPAAEWGSITGSWEFQHRSTQPGLWDSAPSTGQLPRELAERLVGILSRNAENRDRGQPRASVFEQSANDGHMNWENRPPNQWRHDAPMFHHRCEE